jgi:hypothetical protein
MVMASTTYFHIKTRHELSVHIMLIIERQQPLRRPGDVMEECARHFVVDVQGIKMMGLALPDYSPLQVYWATPQFQLPLL